MIKKIIYLLIIISLYSCASSYEMINPETLAYSSVDNQNGIKLEYKYDVLEKKYGKKEKRKSTKVVAVKISNTTANDLTLGKNLFIQNGTGDKITLLENPQIFGPLKQNVPAYLLYMLLTPMTLNKTTTDTNTGVQEMETIFPLGFIVGPGITALNMITASSSNKKFKTELTEKNLIGKTIKAGETVSGLIGLQSDTFTNLSILTE